jgi:hypothetical protein
VGVIALMRRRWPLVALLLAAVALSACGSSDQSMPPPSTEALTEPGGDRLEHIHGLGAARDQLFIATHTGLWSVPASGGAPQRVGTSRQDVMGFSVARPGLFLGSGHPGPDQSDLPPHLGLIASRDGGKNWTPVSLTGQADFHVLKSAGQRVYGFDGRLRVSSDGGRSWQQRTPPAGIYDLALDPRRPDRLVASTERGLFASTDAGRTWRRLRDDLAGLLAWTPGNRLYLFAGDGSVSVSSDGGRQWTAAGSPGGQPAAVAADGTTLFAALTDNSIKRSADAGRSWTTVIDAT